MKSNSKAGPTALSTVGPADEYEAAFWQNWRTRLGLVLQKPWLAAPWLKESHTLLACFNRIYSHLCRQPRYVRRRIQRQLGASLAGVALMLALSGAPVQAAVITVNGTTCTLVDAITAANTDTATGGCAAGSGADTITLLGNVTLTAANSGYDGLPSITSAITIEGGGFTIARDASAPEFRLLTVESSGNLTLNNTTISGGQTSYLRGGGIANLGGALTLNHSTVSGNTAAGGGGISSFYAGSVTLNNSTVNGNTAEVGGGILFVSGAFLLNNSTVSGNTATDGGGGIFVRSNAATATLNNSTISGNTATNNGGGIFNDATPLTLVRSLVSGNTSSEGGEIYNAIPYCPPGVPDEFCPTPAVINSANFNLFGHSGESNAQAFTNFTPSGSDLTATSDGTTPTTLASILNPTLANNGGGTLTHALVAGSPAIDAASDSGLNTDQRSITRPQGTADDIGAVEVQAINGSVTQINVTTANNPTPQSCPATGTNLAINTITPTFQNSSTSTFTDLFFRVKTLEYTAPQGGAVPSLCNATTVVDNGGVGSMLAVPNSSLLGDNNQLNPSETLTQAFQIGRPVAAQFRLKVDLFSSTVTSADSGGTGSAGEEYLGSLDYKVDENGQLVSDQNRLFLPLVVQ